MIEGKPPKHGRIPCLIAGCGRTAAQEKFPGSQRILCYKCWGLAPRYLRKRKRHIERVLLRMGIERWDQTKPASKERQALILNSKTFDAIVLAIIEAKAGIS